MQDSWQRGFHKAVEVCVEVVETLRFKDFPKIRMQDAGEITGLKILRFAQKNYGRGKKGS